MHYAALKENLLFAIVLCVSSTVLTVGMAMATPIANAQGGQCAPGDLNCLGPPPTPPDVNTGDPQDPDVNTGDPDDNGGTGTNSCGDQGGLTNPLQFCSLSEFLVAILNAVILIVFPFIVLLLVYAGFQFVVAQGKPEAISKAKQAFLWTLIGALVVLGAKALSIAICATVDEIQGQNSSVCG